MLSRFFIDRPVLALVASLFIIIAGLASAGALPVGQYPDLTPPVVQVTATYPGASAALVEQTVAAPIESALGSVDGLMYMSSTSFSNGVASIALTFEPGSDADLAALNVNNLIKQVDARLPQEVRRQGVVVEKGSTAFLQVVAFYAPDGGMDDLAISNYVTLNVLDRIKRIPGTSNVQIFGAKDYAMRIWLKPDKMAQMDVGVDDVTRALNEQNAQFAAGRIGQSPAAPAQQLVYTVTSGGRLETAQEFGDVIVRARPDGSQLRLKDIARVELGARDYDFVGRINGKPATLVGIYLKSGANALQTGARVKQEVAALAQRFPNGMRHAIPYDTTRFVEVSIREVLLTLAEAMALVFLVVFLFLQNWRATLIPFAAVPVSLIGTLAGLLLLGYSINTLTLFGMVLAIGIVVDDAIVVLENIERLMHEQHLAARAAALQAMREVTGPVVAIVLTLCAVFVPIAFLGGLTGVLYRQFAVTISMAVVLSGVVALTLTPALCVLLLGPARREPHGFFRWFNAWFAAVTRRYTGAVAWMIKRSALGLVLFAAMVALTAGLWRTIPGSLVPDEDQGYYIAALYLPDGASLQRTDSVVGEALAAIRSNPANKDVIAFTGLDFIGGGFKNSAATFVVTQQDWSRRSVSTQALVGEFFAKTAGIKEALAVAFNPPAIPGLGNTGGIEFYLQNHGEGGNARLQEGMQALLAAAGKSGVLAGVQTLSRPSSPQLHINVDRDKAKALGIALDSAFNTVSAMLGTYYVNDFNKSGRAWQVLLSADIQYRQRPDDIGRIFVRSEHGRMVPLSAFAKVEFSSGADSLARFNNLPALPMIGSAAPGYSSGQALAEIERIAREVLPPGISLDWSGASFQEKRAAGSTGLTLAMAAFMVFLILAAQHERWLLPLPVLLALPFGLFGALVAVAMRGLANDVYFQIGLVTLLGLAAKNAILIVEFAVLKSGEGCDSAVAAIEAARLRFRPILMTSLAFILGVLPLAFSSGAGAEARRSVGTGVMGGMLAATFLAIFFVPLFYTVVDRVAARRAGAPAAQAERRADRPAVGLPE
ncbi:efflux RND transporter permease subunit [Massilia aquatica]|uniref:Efflux pump membrane transporter n=1 Tax=Massilia aquatica TaxID=2609000 RepID=A0ABX0MM95_9BURK|nr:multidrug efflux RND transporter permease subunit [Massilia aquatica]NHZ44674.1 multidrug efflux RND transporter permease subunit [Massilia aquatica]